MLECSGHFWSVRDVLWLTMDMEAIVCEPQQVWGAAHCWPMENLASKCQLDLSIWTVRQIKNLWWKKQRHYVVDKSPYSQSYGFSSSHVWMWELDYKESWGPKNWCLWCFWTVVLGKTSESPLDCKDIQPVNPKGNRFWISIGRTDAETLILWPPDVKNWLLRKDSDAGKDWRQEEKGMTEDEMVGWHHQLDGHEFEQAPGVGDGQGSLVCCSPRVAKSRTWLSNWTELSCLKTGGQDKDCGAATESCQGELWRGKKKERGGDVSYQLPRNPPTGIYLGWELHAPPERTMNQAKYGHKQDAWPETTWKLTPIPWNLRLSHRAEQFSEGSLTYWSLPRHHFPVFCFVSTCVSLNNSFQSVRQKSTRGPWKRFLFLQQDHCREAYQWQHLFQQSLWLLCRKTANFKRQRKKKKTHSSSF